MKIVRSCISELCTDDEADSLLDYVTPTAKSPQTTLAADCGTSVDKCSSAE